MGSIHFWRIALRLEVWGYTNQTRLRGFQRVREGGLRLCSRDFQSPGVSSKSGCSPLMLPTPQDIEKILICKLDVF